MSIEWFGGHKLISVIIPVYNVENYILYCLKSLECQEYQNFEVIIINDGSTDNSENVIRKYADNSKLDIVIKSQINSGVSAARNAGIEIARGDYLCFIDSDDMVTPNYLSEMNRYVSDCDIVICKYQEIDENETNPDVETYSKRIKKMSKFEALESFLFRDIEPGVWAILINSHTIKANGLEFSEGYRYSEDIEFIYKILAASSSVVYIENSLYLYRIRNSSVMSLVDEKRLDGMRLMKQLEIYFYENCRPFYIEYVKFGVARWVWATLWQCALASKNFVEFKENALMIEADAYIKNLLGFPRLKVKVTSLIYVISPKIYYRLITLYGKVHSNARSFTSERKDKV